MKTAIEMAREAGAIHIHKRPKEFAVVGNEAIERLVALARADEREACAKVCDEYDDEYDVHTKQTVEGIAFEIRARGDK